MGESVNDAPNAEDKMEARISSNHCLQVSVSFGRFENDSLSWEKFSSFSPNKYLEEVEKYATPGSVAQKKAYFEAHYKKVAERKAELMDQDKQPDKKASIGSSDQNHQVSCVENCRIGSDISVSGGQCSYEEDKHVTELVSQVNEIHINEPNEETEIVKECQTLVEDLKLEADDSLDTAEFGKSEQVVDEKEEEVKEEITSKRSQDRNKILEKDLKKQKESTPKIKERSVKTDRTKCSPKINQVNKKTPTNKNTPASKDRSVKAVKKNPVSPASKATAFSAPRVSKPASTFSSTSLSRPLIKMENFSTLPRTKNPSAAGNKQMAPKSLHMSLSLGPSGSDPSALMAERKSLIMESMGDKDIVKRAFKTFQNSYNRLKSSSGGQTAVTKQVPAKATKVSSLGTPQKENGGSVKAGGVEKKSVKATPSSFGLTSNEKAMKRKEFSKNLREKSNDRFVRLQTKPKEGEVKNRRHSLDPKAKPTQSLQLVQKVSKGSSDRGGLQE